MSSPVSAQETRLDHCDAPLFFGGLFARRWRNRFSQELCRAYRMQRSMAIFCADFTGLKYMANARPWYIPCARAVQKFFCLCVRCSLSFRRRLVARPAHAACCKAAKNYDHQICRCHRHFDGSASFAHWRSALQETSTDWIPDRRRFRGPAGIRPEARDLGDVEGSNIVFEIDTVQ